LAGLQRQDEAAAAVDVARLARDAPGHAAQVRLGGGEEPEGRPAEVQAVAERLALADADVDAALTGRLENAERDRVVASDDHAPVTGRHTSDLTQLRCDYTGHVGV